MADASILVEIEAVISHVTQLADADLARYLTSARTIQGYNSGYTEAQRAQASKLVQVLYAEQERRKGVAPANTNTGGSTSKPPASKTPAKTGGKTSGQTQAPPPEPEPPAEPAPASSDGVGVVLVVGGLTALAAVTGGLVYRSTKRRQGGM